MGGGWRRLVLFAALGVSMVPLLSGCATPHYRFVSSAEHDLVLKIPNDWNQISFADVQKAAGETGDLPAGTWLAIYDGAPKPSVKHLQDFSAAAPLVTIRSSDMSAEVAATLTDDQLRDMVLPVSPEARAQFEAQEKAQNQPLAVFKMIQDQTVTTKTEHGVHVVFGYDQGTGEEVFDQVVVTDAKKTRVHILLVHCSLACFRAQRSEITAVTDSVTVKKPL